MMVVVPSVGHIEAGSRMVPMAVSLTDPNSDAADRQTPASSGGNKKKEQT